MIPIVGYKNCTLNSRLQRLGQSSEALPILRYSHTCMSSIKLHACCIINLLVTISRSFMARRKSEQVASAEKRLVERVRLFFKKERRAKHRISLNRVTDRLVAMVRRLAAKAKMLSQERISFSLCLNIN